MSLDRIASLQEVQLDSSSQLTTVMDVSSPAPMDAQSSSMSTPRKRPAPVEPCFDYNIKGECDANECVYLHECGICGKEGSLRLHPECLYKVGLTSSPKKDTQDVAIGPDLDPEESTVVPPSSASNGKDPKSDHAEDLVISCGPATLTATEMAKDEAMTDAFLAAVKAGSLDTVRVFVKILQVDPSVAENAAIKWAAQLGHESVVELLLGDSRVDPSADSNYAIGISCKNGKDHVVRVNPAAKGNYALKKASKNGHEEIVRLILQDKRISMDAILLILSNMP